MMNVRPLIVLRCMFMLLSLALLPACAREQPPSAAYMKRFLPRACNHWSVDVVAPSYMEAWVEDLEVKDDRSHWIKIPKGVVGELGQTAGWPPPDRIGSFGPVFQDTGAPMEIILRWQSLAEPQTYTWHFIVPDSLREALVKKEPVTWYGKPDLACRGGITLGVAPGGRVVVWIGGLALPSVEVLRSQARVESLGPGQGWGKGYAYPLSPEAQQYVNDHGIPYGSWDQ